MKRSSLLRNASLLSFLIPAFFVMEHVGPEGFPEAQGCSGRGPDTGSGAAPSPSAVIHRSDPAATNIEVGSDGFFLVDIYSFTNPLQFTLDVTTPDGAVVTGKQQLIETSAGQSLYAWSADEPLALGTKLRVLLRASPYDIQDEATLDVVAAPAKLEPGEPSISEWVNYGHGVGAEVTCNTFGAACSLPGTAQVPSAEQVLHGAYYSWAASTPVRGFVAWEIEVERKTPPPAEEPLETPAPTLFLGSPSERLYLGLLPFASTTRDYCATIKVRDLRSDAQVTTELCSEPGTAKETVRDYNLSQCASPPSEALTEAWCKSHPGSSVRACAPYDPTVMPIDPMPIDPMPIDPMPMEPENPGDTKSSGSRTSSGCQMARGMAQHAPFAAFVAALALGALVRRRRAQR
jgi:hypothetical protein